MPNPTRLVVCAAALCLATACAARVEPPAIATAPVSVPAAPPAGSLAPSDPVSDAIAASERHFAAGHAELEQGHLDGARIEFNRAVHQLLDAPGGALSDSRVRDQFERLVDRVSALELMALATGDGFTEKRYEKASIDDLLSVSTFADADASAETADLVRADLSGHAPDIPIPTHAKVLRYVEAFQGRLREFLAEGLSRGARYLPMVQSVFRAEGVPLDLAYVPLVESAFKPNALSRARAKGMWQFMRGTAVENGLRHDWFVDERADPEKATRAAARYLRTLFDTFGDWHLALASYNGGPGRVQRAMKRSGRGDFWALSATSRYLPRETREYVPMVLAAVLIARNPAQYGFDVLRALDSPAETVVVPPAVDLRRIAEWAGVGIDEVQRLNPELRRWTTPVGTEPYSVKVPAGSAARVAAALEQAPPGSLNALQWHTVRRGESLASIARRLRVSRADLAEANRLRANSRVSPGQRLLIPRMPSAALLARAAAGGAPAEAAAPSRDAERIVYRVRAGDTLYAIARRHGITVADLREWNGVRGSRIRPGDRLVIHVASAAGAQEY